MLLGGGANGKSTLVSLLTKLMGDYAANTAASTLMASSNNQLGDDLIRLAGAGLLQQQKLSMVNALPKPRSSPLLAVI